MSASLVGSEMCIRDRPAAGHQPARRPHRRPHRPADRAAPHASILPQATVSYTHLTLPTICSV
eukprot:1767550-Alexandrium_andersonii.AAC.1